MVNRWVYNPNIPHLWIFIIGYDPFINHLCTNFQQDILEYNLPNPFNHMQHASSTSGCFRCRYSHASPACHGQYQWTPSEVLQRSHQCWGLLGKGQVGAWPAGFLTKHLSRYTLEDEPAKGSYSHHPFKERKMIGTKPPGNYVRC